MTISIGVAVLPILFLERSQESSISRIKIKKSLCEVPRKHGTRVVDRLCQLTELPLVDGATVVRVILPEQDWAEKRRQWHGESVGINSKYPTL